MSDSAGVCAALQLSATKKDYRFSHRRFWADSYAKNGLTLGFYSQLAKAISNCNQDIPVAFENSMELAINFGTALDINRTRELS